MLTCVGSTGQRKESRRQLTVVQTLRRDDTCMGVRCQAHKGACSMVNITKPTNTRTIVPSLSLSLSPANPAETPPFLSPMPSQLVLRHVTLTNTCEEFVQGIDGGIESYFDGDYPLTTLTAQALLHDLLETLREDGTSLAWRLRF